MEGGRKVSNLQLATAAAVASLAEFAVALQSLDTKTKHTPVRGRIVGRDYGKGPKKQPRNAPCVCGSGKKAKHCCAYK
jgi:uncharacterized protein YchJ